MPPKRDPLPEPNVVVPDGDQEKGRAIFAKHCATCHSLQEDDKASWGPNLKAIVGRAAGSTKYKYSKTMKAANLNWSEKHLFAFLQKPTKYIPGIMMAFDGLENEQERADLIAYLAKN